METTVVPTIVESVRDLFSKMLSCHVSGNQQAISVEQPINSEEVSAVIGITGETQGTMTLLLPESTALAIASKMLGSTFNEMDEMVADAVAEVINIVAGSAKAKMVDENARPLDLSLPTVIHGSQYTLHSPDNGKLVNIFFSSELGDFNLRLTLS